MAPQTVLGGIGMGKLYCDDEYILMGEVSYYYELGSGLALRFAQYLSYDKIDETIFYTDMGFFGVEVEMI